MSNRSTSWPTTSASAAANRLCNSRSNSWRSSTGCRAPRRSNKNCSSLDARKYHGGNSSCSVRGLAPGIRALLSSFKKKPMTAVCLYNIVNTFTHCIALGDLWLHPIGGEPERLTEDSFVELHPAWSSDGERLVYGCDRAGTIDLWIRNLRTGEDRQLTDRPGAETYPAWSPDNSLVAFSWAKAHSSSSTSSPERCSICTLRCGGRGGQPGLPTGLSSRSPLSTGTLHAFAKDETISFSFLGMVLPTAGSLHSPTARSDREGPTVRPGLPTGA